MYRLLTPGFCVLMQTIRTFLAKAFGVSFAIASGLFAGKEGPFVVRCDGASHKFMN